jgi:hypothetical protein
MPEPVAIEEVFRGDLKKNVGGRYGLYPLLETLTTGVPTWYDDFFGDSIRPEYSVNSDSGATDLAVIAGQLNGLGRLNAGATNDEASEFSLGLHFTAEQNAVIAVRIRVNTAVTNSKLEIGFTDVIAAGADQGAVGTLSDVNSFNATDCAVWVYDTDDTGNSNWQGTSRDNGDSNPFAKYEPSGLIGPAADTFETMVVALTEYSSASRYGAVRFLRLDSNEEDITTDSGWLVGDVGGAGANGRITSNVLLCPWVFLQARDTGGLIADIDYIKVWQRRT